MASDNDPTTGELKIRLDHHDLALADLRADVHATRGEMKLVADALVATNLLSGTNHATTQAQNVAILERLNRPNVILSILGNPATVGGIVTILGAIVAAAAAFGYTNGPEKQVPVVVPIGVAASQAEGTSDGN